MLFTPIDASLALQAKVHDKWSLEPSGQLWDGLSEVPRATGSTSGWNQTAQYGGTVMGMASCGWLRDDHFKQVLTSSGHVPTTFF